MNLTDASASTWEFLRAGGFFMLLLALCSLAAVTVIVYKFRNLRRESVLPSGLEDKMAAFDDLLEQGRITELEPAFTSGESTLARLGAVAVQRADRSHAEAQEAVQSAAREELVKMNTGLAVLEVVTTIAPLLGLLGTASGLVTVFGDLDSTANIQKGIATALSTTVVGIAVSVPAVIAHSFFSRRIETYAARLEVLLGGVVSACTRPADH